MGSGSVLRFSAALACAVCLQLAALSVPAWALKEGDAFPHFTGVDLDGTTVDTKAFAKKVILVDFWSVYCSSCVAEMPHIVKLYETYKDKGLVCIGIDLDPMMPPAKVKKFLAGHDFPMPYPNVQDNKRQIMGLLGVSILPTTVVVDTAGVVRLFHIGYKPGYEKELEEIVVKLLPPK